MKILFLSISTAVKDLKNRGIYPDLINYFSANGHEMFVVCPAERRLKQATSLKVQANVHTLSVKTLNITKSNFIEKGIATILIESQFEKAIKQYFKGIKFDLILYATPPISFNALIKKLKSEHHSSTYLMLKDIFPQNAVDLKLIKKGSLLYSYFRRKEELLYAISDHIGCMSDANVEYVLRNNPKIPKDKVVICPNAIKIIERNPANNKAALLKKFDIPEGVPIFLYGGNLGIAQGIPFLIEILESNKHRKDFFLLIVGSGNRYDLLNQWVIKNQPANIRLIHQLDRVEYDRLESMCDVGLIFLDEKFTIPNFPSRMLSYLECRLPLLISTDPVSDAGTVALKNGFGLWSQAGNVEAFNQNLNYYIANGDIRAKMGERGFEFLKHNYDVSVAYNAIIDTINR